MVRAARHRRRQCEDIIFCFIINRSAAVGTTRKVEPLCFLLAVRSSRCGEKYRPYTVFSFYFMFRGNGERFARCVLQKFPNVVRRLNTPTRTRGDIGKCPSVTLALHGLKLVNFDVTR